MKFRTAVFLVGCWATAVAIADGSDGSGRPGDPPSERKLAIADVVENRGLVIDDILGRAFLPTGGNLSDRGELAISLGRLSDGRLADAWLARDKASLERAVLGAPLSLEPGAVGEKFLGSATTDLVYYPLSTPCRLFDSRFDDRGPMTANTTRAFAVQGTFISNQGGNSGANNDCPEVPFDPPAIVFTLTSVDSVGMGNLRVWPANDPTPFVAHVSYPGGINLSNTTVTTVCQNCGSQNDINVRTQNGLSQVIGDIIGYFERPQGCPAGTTEIAGDCYQTSLRAAATSVFVAAADCEDEGGRLPSAGGTLLALNTLTGAVAGEYTDNIYNADVANGANDFRVLRITNGGTLVSAFTLDDAQYRCVFDLFDFN